MKKLFFFWSCFIWIGALASNPPTALAAPFSVSIDTSSLSGSAAQLAFDLIDGDGAINNSAIISGFSTDGTLGSSTSTGGVSGNLPGAVTLSDSEFFNELLQMITLGSFIDFALDLTSNFAGGIPDSFSFFILDDATPPSSSLVTTDLLGDALFIIDIDGTALGAVFVASQSEPSVPVTLTSRQVPEPGAILLLALGLPLISLRNLIVRHRSQ